MKTILMGNNDEKLKDNNLKNFKYIFNELFKTNFLIILNKFIYT
jgi:hypothetical protein